MIEDDKYFMPVKLTAWHALKKSFGVILFYVAVIIFFFALLPDRAWYLKRSGIVVIGAFGVWRYSWQVLHIIRMFGYKRDYYPKIRESADKLENKYPRRLFFVIPSYFEDPQVTLNVVHSIMRECMTLPCETICICLSVGSDEEISNINHIITEDYEMPNLKVIFMKQKSGKRIAMGHALRAAAREFNRVEDYDDDNENDLVVLMDGDSMLVKGIMDKCLPLFRLKPNLGIVTPNNVALALDLNTVMQSWYELKFIQRHHQFQSHSLSGRILTATGRFSIFRAPIVFSDEFIRFVEADYLEHWLFGRFNFLMGDDKSTWFYCLKEGYEMLYVPDAHIIAVEGRTDHFISTSISLMTRWNGNMLRNNIRAINLGPKKNGLFYMVVLS